jgi:bifunctional DNA-binding transcriptional regulator/antitoxin component of YhaV-PrlF toxin-antitoxin module
MTTQQPIYHKVQRNGIITLPAEARKDWQLEKSDSVRMWYTGQAIVIMPDVRQTMPSVKP